MSDTRISIDGGATWIEWPGARIVLSARNGGSLLAVEWPSSEPAEPLIPLVGAPVALVVEVGRALRVRYFGRALLESVETAATSSALFVEAPSCEEDRWRRHAETAIAVVVPALRRPHRAAPFMESLQDPASVYAVVGDDDPDTASAWIEAGANVLSSPRRTFSEKVNYAYLQTNEPWLFLVGDDVQFHAGWADELLRVASVTGALVVGSNDLANPRAEDGSHSPHMLISRQYVADRGASWDGPSIVCHSGYRHMFVDDEIVTVAKQRGVFAFARAAVVEHLHPVAGKAEVDATYRLGWSYAEVDKSRFAERMREYAL